MQVERLAIGIAAGGAADFDEFLDLRVPDGEIHRRRAAAQRALGDGEGEGVHDADEGDDAGGFAVLADFFADGAQIAPVGADAAALGGEPDILVPEADDAFEGIRRFVEEAGDRQAAIRAAVGEDGSGRHEPHFGDIVIQALGVGGIVPVIGGDAGEEVLVAFAREQIAVIQGGAAEIGQQGVAGAVDMDLVAAAHLHAVIEQHGFRLRHHVHVARTPVRKAEGITTYSLAVTQSLPDKVG